MTPQCWKCDRKMIKQPRHTDRNGKQWIVYYCPRCKTEDSRPAYRREREEDTCQSVVMAIS